MGLSLSSRDALAKKIAEMEHERYRHATLAYQREQERLKTMATREDDRPKATALAAEAAFFTWLGVMIVLVALTFILGGGWAVFWPLLGIGVAALFATAVLLYAGGVWIQAWRASRRTRVSS